MKITYTTYLAKTASGFSVYWVNLGPGSKKFGSYKEVIVLNILKYKYCVGKSRNLELLTNWWPVQERKSGNYMCVIYIKHF